jgi:abortive infection bacteriophage resistance protein
MNKKEFRTLDEQVNIMINKGLVVNDVDKAKDVLLRENYFFINGYRTLFYTKDRRFIEGTTFDELYSLFLFDRNLRNIIFKYILVFENNIKSIISYQLSKKYGYKEKDYLSIKNFNQDLKERRRVEDVINKMKRQIRINGEKHTATFHYITKYHYIPLWILVKVLSFGLINELFGILKEEDQNEIAAYYKMDKEDLKVYLQLLSNYRNLCAHEDILYEHRTQTFIGDTYYHEKFNMPKNELGEYIKGKNDLFALIIILKQVLQADRFKEMMAEINRCFDIFNLNVNTIDLNKLFNKMGFPEKYMDIIDMDGGLNE